MTRPLPLPSPAPERAPAGVSDAPLEAPPGAPVAYLAPELYGLSATFVYEEIAALERRGWAVAPFSVHRPAQPARGQEALQARTRVLYDGAPALLAGAARGAWTALRHPVALARALGWLVQDVLRVGPHRLAAWKLVWQWAAALRLARWLRQRGCVHLHIHFAHVPAQIGMYAAALSGLGFTITAHANDIFERKLLLPQKARRAQALLTISDYNRRYLQTQGVPDARLAVVRCGVSLQAGAPRPAAAAGTPLRVGSLGRLVEKKGMDVLLRALAQAVAQGQDLQLDIAGDGPLREPLQALAQTLGVAPRVRFLGAMGHAQVAAWLGSLDVFALACQVDAQGDMDGVPVALMEAMSQGVPVLSTRLSGIPELVVDGQTGLLAEPGHADSLAAQLMRLAGDAALRSRLGAAGARHALDEFSQQVNLDRLTAHFRRALAAAGRT
ncbi:glycosyltransferase family 4 protein [Ideonella livida]|uniref:Glycosyltransferase family 4 protein n=1 Tax=Ideonella livida TaxID=2707176 RepID=A0A7C9PIF0_9BURK|nr:glycosyltransferase family 4 protein [Ideonella livida]NDY91914.1 glycosyltransferase family 4 protein [Ideonella livida]